MRNRPNPRRRQNSVRRSRSLSLSAPEQLENRQLLSVASFLGTDTTTSGNWTGAYGADGYALAAGPSALPSYATVSIQNKYDYTWESPSTDPAALVDPALAPGQRIAATWSAGTPMTIDVHLAGTQTHRVALYALDWDGAGSRSERIDVLDDATGAVLDTRSIVGYCSGEYLAWNASGNVTFRVTSTCSNNANMSGLFFDGAGSTLPPPPSVTSSAAFLGTDTTTSGAWTGVYGTDGYALAAGPSALPAYATVDLRGKYDYVWESPSQDTAALTDPALGAGKRIASTWSSGTTMTIDVHLSGNQARRVALYALDWDNAGARTEQVQVIEDATGTVLDTRSIGGFTNGTYLAWNLTGNVTFRVSGTNGWAPDVSALFFDAAANALPPPTSTLAAVSFLGTDTTTSGSWTGAYGADGYSLAAGSSVLPTYATVNVRDKYDYTWEGSTTDPRALTDPALAPGQRRAATWASSPYVIDVRQTGSQTHRVALYALDWEGSGSRSEQVQVVDDATGTVLDTRTISAFNNGVYLAWNVTGNVTFRMTGNGGVNALVSGLFFGGSASSLPFPTNLQANAGAGQVALNWSYSGSTAQGFRVERSDDGTHYAVIGTTATGVTSYIDTTVSGSRDYWYQVRAFNGSGVSLPSPSVEAYVNAPVSTGFLGGTVFVDLNGNSQLDPNDAYLPGAVVELFPDGATTPSATTTTDSFGAYQFTGLAPGGYTIEEIPPTGYRVGGAQSLAQLNPATVNTDHSIHVTVRDTTQVFVNYNGVDSSRFEVLNVSVKGTGQANAVGPLLISLGTSAGVADLNAGYGSFCVNDLETLSFSGGEHFQVSPKPISSLDDGSTTVSADHAGRIAYLYNHYASANFSAIQVGALQLAIWKLLYDANTTDFSTGNFQVTGVYDTSYTTAADIAAMETQAQAYMSESSGKREAAVFLDSKPYNPGQTEGLQSLLATGSANFADVQSQVVPTGTLAGEVYDDLNNDGRVQIGEPGIGGVTVTLTGTTVQGATVTETEVTDGHGMYRFDHLQPGTYVLAETGPSGAIAGKVAAGSLGGTVGTRLIANVHVAHGATGSGYDFGEDRPPSFTTTPITTINVGSAVVTSYTYQANATDPDKDTLHYALLQGPAGMQVNSTTGVLTWTPPAAPQNPADAYPVALRVDDGRGGTAEQDFTLRVLRNAPNHPPVFTSTPVVDAYVETTYSYQATAYDPDLDPLTFSVVSGPAGLTIGSQSGAVGWTPTAQQLGLNHVVLRVDDGRGGYATQPYDIMVHDLIGPRSIKIISTPVTTYDFPTWTNPSSIVVNTTIRDVQSSYVDVQQGLDTGVVTGLVDAQLGLLQIAAGATATKTPAIVDNDTGQISDPSATQNGALSFATSGTGWSTETGGHHGTQLVASSGTGSNTAAWRFTGLAVGDYVIQATWHNRSGLATNATYQVSDGTNSLASAAVNQTQAPSGTALDSQDPAVFQTLVTVHVTSGTLVVVLGNNANGTVAADAVRIAPTIDFACTSLSGPASASAGGTISLQRSYTVSGAAAPAGVMIAYYASPNTQLGQGGDVLLGTETLTASSDLSVGTHAGSSPSLTLPATGGTYHLFARINAAGTVAEYDAYDSQGILDDQNDVWAASQALTVSGPAAFTPTFVDDAGAGFSSTGSGWSTVTSTGYSGQVHKTGSAGTGTNTATWTLTGLASGDYQVAVTWTAAAGQATNASYTLRDGSSVLRSVSVDQSAAPTGPVFGGNYMQNASAFQTLATVHVTGGTLNVVLTDNANGAVVADAVRVRAVQPVDLNWVGGGVSGPTTLAPGGSFTVARQYTVTGTAAPADFTIAYFASTSPTPGGGNDFLLGTETITAAADKTMGTHAGTSPTLRLPAAGGTYYVFATIDAGGTVLEDNTSNDVGTTRDNAPTYSGHLWSGFGGTAIIHSTQSFYAWYHDVPGTNLSETYPLALTKDTSTGLYTFSSNGFFPIDGQLFGNDIPAPYQNHNYNFMLEFHGSFTYHGGETLSISSDDDSWVFIDGQLVSDLGGMHGAASEMVNLDQLNKPSYNGPRVLNLEVGQTYPIDIFYAERQTGFAAFSAATNLQIVPDVPYSYPVKAVDSDGGAITYALVKGPAGMTIDPGTGLVSWMPDHSQVGTYQVIVKATDETGPTDTQTYTLTVSAAPYNGQLSFTSNPVQSVAAGDTYSYTPTVNAPAGDQLTFSLVSTATDQMTIDPVAGRVTWTPQPSDFGHDYFVSIQVSDSRGAPLGLAVQSFNLHAANGVDHAPRFVVDPALSVVSWGSGAGVPTSGADLVIVGIDSNGLLHARTFNPAGVLTLDGVETGLPASRAGAVAALKLLLPSLFPPHPLSNAEKVEVMAALETIFARTIDIAPVTTATAGQLFTSPIDATDPDNDPLTYNLPVHPDGMLIDPAIGKIYWVPTAAQTGPQDVTVRVQDGRGGFDLLPFTITVAPPDQPPQITSVPPIHAQAGLTYSYQVRAEDPDGDSPLAYSLDATSTGRGMVISTQGELT